MDMLGNFLNTLYSLCSEQRNLYYLIHLPINEAEYIVPTIDNTDFLKVINSREGKLSIVENEGDVKDWGKNNMAFPFHLDGAYYSQVPQYVILYCVNPGTIKGGNTFFTKAEDVIQILRNKYDSNLLDSLDMIYVSPQRKKYRHPLLKSVEGGTQLNWYSSAYLEPRIDTISDTNRRIFTQLLQKIMTDIEQSLYDKIMFTQEWKAGDLLLFNNQLLLHGRTQIPEKNTRVLYRIWLDKKTFIEDKKSINDSDTILQHSHSASA